MTLGLFIGRLNPPHFGHLKVIEKAIKENNKVLLLLGTSILKDLDKNPLTFNERKSILEKYFNGNYDIKILEIPDDNSDMVWALHVYKRICDNFPDFSNVNFYFGDRSDTAFTCIKSYDNNFFNVKINYLEVPRENSFIDYNGEKVFLSGTNFRKFLREGNLDVASKFCPQKIFDEVSNFFK